MTVTANPAVAVKNAHKGHVFHISQNHSPNNAGVTAAITQLTRHLVSQAWSTTLLAAGEVLAAVPEGVGLLEFPLHPMGRAWRYSDKMRSYYIGIKNYSGTIIHLHGVWGAPQLLAARGAFRKGIPTLLTAHDMLSPWHWNKGIFKHLKKVSYWSLLAYPAFRKLTIIHALTPRERDILAKFFPRQRLEVIPNAIDLEEVDDLISESEKGISLIGNSPYILFLGRLDSQKGVDILINAFAKSVKKKKFRLIIVGPDSTPTYTAKLKSLVSSLGIDKQVIFLGPIFGSKKWKLYQNAWACCLPSRSEGMSMVSLEVVAARVPLITTYEAGVLDWEEYGGILVHPRVRELTWALERVFSWNDRERLERGRLMRQLLKLRYSWKAVGPLWLNLYTELLEL